MRKKTCKVCRTKFDPVRPFQVACSIDCSIKHAQAIRGKVEAKIKQAEAKEHKEAKAKAKTRQQWLKEAQTAFNAWIRKRDEHQPCISCGRHHQGQYHAGHYRTTKAAPELRFDEFNVHKQCSVCNNHLSGNIVEYRLGLIKRIGVVAVEWLEGKHESKKYTIDDLKDIKADYTNRLKQAKDTHAEDF